MAKKNLPAAPKKRGPGKPPKFPNVEKLQEAIRNYFDSCFDVVTRKVKEYQEIKQNDGSSIIQDRWRVKQSLKCIRPPTVTGLALACGTCRSTLLRYCSDEEIPEAIPEQERKQYCDTIKNAKTFVEQYNEERLHQGGGVGVIFNMKVNFGRQDTTIIDHQTKGNELPSPGNVQILLPDNGRHAG